ncbi:Six-hairpin glycosidase-like protein [Mucor mucedo]|uniref:Six-hairpin glycosidase-like protein n=1 Tax=Mucor mucedo TaxID=29922 RepID=UPI00221FA637|nr:Six-hairpin glycosidase-like protein [Mucor mucedo]KAI7896105.1 Six-hairpin glycosidase-like protein [Mucor mucedo]
MLSWGGSDYIEGYHMANQTDYLRTQIKWATDWLIKAHPEPSTLIVQVGNVKIDNDYFGPDSGIPIPRPCYQINETHFGTDAASMAATAFASASAFFNNLAQSKAGVEEDAAYADILLMHATQLYNSSHSIVPYSRYQSSVPTILGAYASTAYLDDLLLSGLALYRATEDETYLQQSLEIYKSSPGASSHIEPLDWDNKWGALYVLFAELMLNSSDQTEALARRVDAEIYLDGLVSGTGVNKTNGGLLFWDFYSDANSNQNAMSASHLLLSYSTNVLRPLSETSNDKGPILEKIKRYEDLAKSQLDYVFGKNPIEQNYIVGERSNSPKYPHSAPASGFASLAQAISNPTDRSKSHVIYGALVGGPSRNDSFADALLDWSQTEVALDYNAPYQNLLAYQIMFSADDPYYIPKRDTTNNDKPDSPSDEEPSAGFPSWGIALAVVLPILFIISLFAFLFIRHRQNKIEKNKINSDIEEIMVQQLGIDESHVSETTLVASQDGSAIKKEKI